MSSSLQLLPLLCKLMRKGFVVRVDEFYACEDYPEIDDETEIPVPYAIDTYIYKMIDGQMYIDHGPSSIDEYRLYRVKLRDIEYHVYSKYANNVKVYAHRGANGVSVKIWSKNAGFSKDAHELLRPEGVQTSAIEKLTLKAPSSLPLKIMSALCVRDTFGIEALSQFGHMDYETMVYVLKPIAWWSTMEE